MIQVSTFFFLFENTFVNLEWIYLIIVPKWHKAMLWFCVGVPRHDKYSTDIKHIFPPVKMFNNRVQVVRCSSCLWSYIAYFAFATHNSSWSSPCLHLWTTNPKWLVNEIRKKTKKEKKEKWKLKFTPTYLSKSYA